MRLQNITLELQDWKSYDKYATAALKKAGAKDEKMLNATAWNYYINIEDTKLLSKAKDWAYKAVNLKNTCENNTTYAYSKLQARIAQRGRVGLRLCTTQSKRG
jgi:hypothetical protein